MSNPDDLEKRLEPGGAGLEGTLTPEQRTPPIKNASALRNYMVDTTASWMYWTPVMTVMGTLSGMKADELLKQGLVSVAVYAVIGRPYGMFRQYWADLRKADAASPKRKKFMVDTSAQMCFNAGFYLTVPYFLGASLEEGMAALASSLTVGALFGRLFGYAQDKWRKQWGTKPTLDE